MKNLKFMGWLMLTVISALFTACDDNDGYSIGDLGADWVTVKVSAGSAYSFVGDDWGTMWPAVMPPWNYNPQDGDRAVLYFNPLQDDFSGYDLAIKPVRIIPILTKQVEELTEENEEEYADHPTYMTDAWISGGYMNILFFQAQPYEKAHRVSLVRNTTKENEDDGYVHLEYRYNTYGDTLSNRRVDGAVSYNLSSLDLTEKKGIKMRINSAVNGERILTFNKQIEGKPSENKENISSELKIK